MSEKVETVKVEVELVKRFYEALKNYVENGHLGYDNASEFIEEAARTHWRKIKPLSR